MYTKTDRVTFFSEFGAGGMGIYEFDDKVPIARVNKTHNVALCLNKNPGPILINYPFRCLEVRT